MISCWREVGGQTYLKTNLKTILMQLSDASVNVQMVTAEFTEDSAVFYTFLKTGQNIK